MQKPIEEFRGRVKSYPPGIWFAPDRAQADLLLLSKDVLHVIADDPLAAVVHGAVAGSCGGAGVTPLHAFRLIAGVAAADQPPGVRR